MGADLHYKQTPKETDAEEPMLHYSTWMFLKELFEKGEDRDMDGTIFNKDSIDMLAAIKLTARVSKNNDLEEDMAELISAIKKLDSITLIIKY